MKKEEIIEVLKKHSERIMTDEGDFLFGISDLELLASELSGQGNKISDEFLIKKNIFIAGYRQCENGCNIQKAEKWFDKTYLKLSVEEGKEQQLIRNEMKNILQHYEIYKAVNSLNNSGRTYEDIIDEYLSKYPLSLKAQQENKISDKDIWNAAKEYAEEHGRAFYSEHFQAYKAGATEARDDKIYKAPKDK